jgi:sugar transferase (PEP-CTERM system associated)
MASLVLESGLVFGVLYLLASLNGQMTPQLAGGFPQGYVALTGFVFMGCLVGTRRAILGDEANLRREVVLLGLLSLGMGGLSLLGMLAYFGSGLRLPALLMLQGAIAVPATVAVWRYVAIRFEILDGYRERVLIVGTGQMARQSARWIAQNLKGDYKLVGFADEDGTRLGEIMAVGARIQTGFDTMAEYCGSHADRIIVALDEKRGKLPIKPLMELRLSGVEIEDATSFFERTSGKIAVETMLPSWLIFSDGFRTSSMRIAAKRLTDVALSSLMLLFTAPLMLLVAAAIRVDSHGRALYRQRRMGLNGREFDILKFRSMVQDAEKHSGPTWAGQNDARITRVGRVIRTLRIDELPQLINVLKGEMSFVGPRPERRHFVEQLENEIPYYRLRMTVRPGITGWAQVQYGYGATVEDSLEKLKFDLFYIKNCNLLFDLWIVLRTIKVVLLGSGAR